MLLFVETDPSFKDLIQACADVGHSRIYDSLLLSVVNIIFWVQPFIWIEEIWVNLTVDPELILPILLVLKLDRSYFFLLFAVWVK